MKKIILLACCFFTLLTLSAQTKVTKTNVVGKWALSAIEMPGMFSYDMDKDSLVLGDMLKSQVDPSQLALLSNTMKSQVGGFTKISFVFNADGTAELGTGLAIAQKATYTVDEENSTITTIDAEKKEDILKADILNEKLRVTIKQEQGTVIMVLKKAAS